jgi:hypothetical protein
MMHPKQREWDALLILHWRRDSKFLALSIHCKQLLGEYPEKLAKEGMLRCSAFAQPTMHVRVWVDTNLYPLGVKLWEIEDNKRMLDWLNASTGLDCERSKKATKWQRESNGKDYRAKLHMEQLSLSIDIGKLNRRTGNFNQVKATGRKVGRK